MLLNQAMVGFQLPKVKVRYILLYGKSEESVVMN